MKEKEMDELSRKIQKCQQCDLRMVRKNPVIGNGSLNSKILFIGEAPGFNEDQQGKPFVGRAGNILNKLLEHINLEREDVYIANILKCRPPENRNPQKNEVDLCTPFLDAQIDIIQPQILVPLGNFSYRYLFSKYQIPIDKISVDHGKLFKKQTIMGILHFFPMYHPAVATYNPNKMSILLKDFETLYNFLEKPLFNIQE